MKINEQHYHTIWLHPENQEIIQIIDQRSLPHKLSIENLSNVEEVAKAIQEMHVRGAPLIGVTAALIKATRPTAVNLAWAVDQQLALIKEEPVSPKLFLEKAQLLKQESVDRCHQIGTYGLTLIQEIYNKKQDTVNVLTHCNAGWLACIDYGTATAPIYAAHDAGIPVHVWVDETRPRNQGARITAFELQEHGVAHTVITDNAGGHLMQHGEVDLVLVGTDRTTRTGDVCNKIGTYLKALAAKDNDVPFYVGTPSSSIDFSLSDGLKEIPIELRSEQEVKYIQGKHEGTIKEVLLTPGESPAANYAFDVTPARLVTGLITELGICEASAQGLSHLFKT